MGNALVTGSPARASTVGKALERAGFNVMVADQFGDLGVSCAQFGQQAVDCYVQLPVDIEPKGTTALERVHGLLERGLLARFDAARTVVPNLSTNAAVVLVSGNLLVGEQVNDDQQARLALLRVLAHCVLADAGDRRIWVTVVDHRRAPDEIAEIAVERANARLRMIAEFAEQNADLSYDDWKLALLSLTTSEL